MSTMTRHLEEALQEHTQRLDVTLTRLSHLIYQSILFTKQLVQEEGHANNNNTCTAKPQTNNTEVITNVQVNLDTSVGGTFTVTLGRFIIQNIPVPSDGLWDLDNMFLLMRPNDARQVVVTPASSAPSYINFYLQGRSIGDFGSV